MFRVPSLFGKRNPTGRPFFKALDRRVRNQEGDAVPRRPRSLGTAPVMRHHVRGDLAPEECVDCAANGEGNRQTSLGDADRQLTLGDGSLPAVTASVLEHDGGAVRPERLNDADIHAIAIFWRDAKQADLVALMEGWLRH